MPHIRWRNRNPAGILSWRKASAHGIAKYQIFSEDRPSQMHGMGGANLRSAGQSCANLPNQASLREGSAKFAVRHGGYPPPSCENASYQSWTSKCPTADLLSTTAFISVPELLPET